MQNIRRLRPPEFALSDFYPADGVFNARSSFQKCDWHGAGLPACDFQTGTPLRINGTLPVVCSAAVCSDRTKRLFEAAGLPDITHTITYYDRSDYESVLADCHRQQKSLIVQDSHLDATSPCVSYWIDQDLFDRLNNRAFASELVPEQYLPERTVLRASELQGFWNSTPTRPLVLKAAADIPGRDRQKVAIVHTDREFEAARIRLASGEQMIAEEYLTIADHYRVNYAADGRQILLLGYCDQIMNEDGRYAGIWISLVRHPPQEVIEVGFEMMHRAARRGYCGVAGFEIVRDRNGRILVIDLGFRLYESTPAVMWQNRLLSRKGSKCVGRVIVWGFHQSVDPDLSMLRELVDSDWFFPLAVYDPQASPYRFDEVRVRGILFGSSRYQVKQRLQKLHRKFGVTEERSGSSARAA